MLFVESSLHALEAFVLLQLLELFLEALDLLWWSFFVALKIGELGQIKLGNQFRDALVAYPLVELFEEAQVLIEHGHEARQILSLNLGGAFSIAHNQAVRRALHHDFDKLAFVFDVLLRLALLQREQRRLSNEDVAALNQLLHVPEEKCQQQRADVASVDIGVRHQNDLAVTHFRGIEIIFCNAGAERRDHGANFFMRQHLVVTRLLDIEDFSLERQNRLEAPVAALLRRAACRFALDQEQLATVRVAFGAVRQLARQPSGIERSLAPRQIPSFAGRFTRPGSIHSLVDDLLGYRRILLKERSQALIHKLRDRAGNVGVELALRLPFKLRLWQLHADDRDQAFTHIVAGEILFYVFEQSHLLPGIVDGAGQSRAESGKMRASVDGIDVVGEAENRFRVRVVVLQTNFHVNAVAVVLHINRLVVQHLLATIQVLDEFRDAAVVLELGMLRFTGLRIRRAFVR